MSLHQMNFMPGSKVVATDICSVFASREGNLSYIVSNSLSSRLIFVNFQPTCKAHRYPRDNTYAEFLIEEVLVQ